VIAEKEELIEDEDLQAGIVGGVPALEIGKMNRVELLK
jgi:hypothetical protein